MSARLHLISAFVAALSVCSEPGAEPPVAPIPAAPSTAITPAAAPPGEEPVAAPPTDSLAPSEPTADVGSSGQTALVRTGVYVVRGSLSREVVRRVVQRHLSEIRACYEPRLAAVPTLEGRVATGFVISSTGAVASASIASSTLNDPPAEQCILRAVQGWTFPAPSGGVVAVEYPFVLSWR